MNYIGTSMHDAMFTGESAAALKDKAFHAVKFDNDGNIALCDTEGEVVLGVLPAEEGNKAKGDTVTVQIKDIALMVAGGEIAAGAAVTTDANGKAKAATAGNFIIGYAMKAATGAGKVIPVQIAKGVMQVGSGGSAEPTYETIFSVTMPQTTLDDGMYSASFPYADLTEDEKAAVESMYNDNDPLYLNDTDTPLGGKTATQGRVMYFYNFDGEHPIDDTKPVCAVLIFKNGDAFSGIAIGSSVDITGEKVEIIKRSGAGSAGGSLIVTIPSIDPEHETIGTPDKTLEEIGAALNAKQPVFAKLIFGNGQSAVVPLKSAYKADSTYVAVDFSIETEPYGCIYQIMLAADHGGTSASIEEVGNLSEPFYDVPFELDVDQNDNVIIKSDETLHDVLEAISGGKIIVGKCNEPKDLTINGESVHFDVFFCAPLSVSKMTSADASSYYTLSTLFEGNIIKQTFSNTSDTLFFKL